MDFLKHTAILVAVVLAKALALSLVWNWLIADPLDWRKIPLTVPAGFLLLHAIVTFGSGKELDQDMTFEALFGPALALLVAWLLSYLA